ncbi:hypothetical protein ACIA5C_48460, partial [Actinoplanes sp. NPDC051343]|uniref:hypothetical protein n=1 Tax=Actinoplanes sp. NPDC051343 TaxID=3363906 RepID=UPI0037AEADFF
MPSQPIRPLVQLPVRQLNALEHHRNHIRTRPGLRPQQVRQRRHRYRPGSVVELIQDHAPLSRTEHVDPGDRLVR